MPKQHMNPQAAAPAEPAAPTTASTADDEIAALMAEIEHTNAIEAGRVPLEDEAEALALLRRRDEARLELAALRIVRRSRRNRDFAERDVAARHEERLTSLRQRLAEAEAAYGRAHRIDCDYALLGRRVDTLRERLREVEAAGPDAA